MKEAPSRRFDPERRSRIIEAALRLGSRDGIHALTMRSVATEAQVPLGSMSYHFTDKDELLLAVVHHSREESRDFSKHFLESHIQAQGFAVTLAQLVEELTVRQHRRLVFDHDLYFLALRHPRLQSESEQWSEDFHDLIGLYVNRDVATVLSYLFDGMCMQSAVFGREFAAADVVRIIEAVIDGAGSPDPASWS